MTLFIRRIHLILLTSLAIALFFSVSNAANNAHGAEAKLAILPSEISLSTIEAKQRIVVQQIAGDQFMAQIHEGLELSSSDSTIVKIVNGVALPVKNGEAIITAKVGQQFAQAKVVVSGQDQPFQWSFRNHVVSVFSKAGCNSGACHGARAGQKGFRLTLFGFDLDADHTYLTRQASGRRITPEDPGRSLLLTKPTGLLPHKGGVRIEIGSPEYRVLSEWIAAGTPPHQDDDPIIERLEVLPKYSIQKNDASQQLIVMAHFSDGHVEDVSRWAKYDSLNTAVSTVAKHGKVQMSGNGEAAIKIWYLNLTQMAYLSVPYEKELTPESLALFQPRNFIDENILAKLKSLNIPPSPPASEGEFMRRAYLDTIGVLPTLEEARSFLNDKSPQKREKLVDALLSRPEFVDYWSYKWSDLLLINSAKLRPKAVEAYYQWIRQQVEQNTPWDEVARQIVTAKGSTLENGAANFYALHQDPEQVAETVSRAFMSLSINCAKCHNHPLEKWTNDQYYGMANMFARVRSKGWGGDSRNGDGNRVVYSDTQGELIQPSKGVPQPPRALDAKPLAFEDPADRRIALAAWLTSPENPYFSRAIVNRVWANFFGVGLVEKVDDLRATNPPSNQGLLDASAHFLVEKKYDLKELMRAILLSSAYQLSSQPLEANVPDNRFYSRYYPRRLKAEVLLDSLSQVTGVATKFKDQKEGVRALQLTDSNVVSRFLNTFGRPDRLATCECERSDEPSMTQVLNLYNGDTLNSKLEAKENRLAKQLKAGISAAQMIEELYLAALTRLPTDEERTQLLIVFGETPDADKRRLVEDLYWSVLTSREFLFNR